MDVVSEAIGAMRAGTAYARRVKEAGSWGWRFPAFVGSAFHVVLDGGAYLITTADPPRALQPGDVILIPSGATHGLSRTARALADLPLAEMTGEPPDPGPADFEYMCAAYRLDHGRVPAYLTTMPDTIVVSPDYRGDPQLTAIIDLLRADTHQNRPGTAASRAALLDLLLVQAVRLWLGEGRISDWPQVNDPTIAETLDRIHRDLDTPWTVELLSRTAGMSRTAFTRRFTAEVGTPPRDYLAGVRLTRGAQLLRQTTDPLATIARQVGYSTEFAFGAAFRREYGISPGRFRAGSAA